MQRESKIICGIFGAMFRSLFLWRTLISAQVFFLGILCLAQTTPLPSPAKGDEWLVATWNACNFGKSKSAAEIAMMAGLLHTMDVVAIQEVSVSGFGAQAVAKLAASLADKGAAWDYVLSDPTSGEGTERYAFLWKPSRLTLLAWPQGARGILATALADSLSREPFLVRFRAKNGKILTFANFHAVPTAKKPQREIALLAALPVLYPQEKWVILGDFNLGPKKKGAYESLWAKGFSPIFPDQKTSLKRELAEDGSYLYQRYDNILYQKTSLTPKEAGIIDFVPQYQTLKEARMLSDHLPIWVRFQ